MDAFSCTSSLKRDQISGKIVYQLSKVPGCCITVQAEQEDSLQLRWLEVTNPRGVQRVIQFL